MPRKNLKIISWNVNGLRAVAKKGFLNILDDLNPDIICLQETKAQVDQLPDEIINISGYHSYFASAERKGYSGVAIYSKEEPGNVKIGMGKEIFDAEGRVLIAGYDDFSLFNCYFPNGGSSPERLQYKMDFYEAVLQYVAEQEDLIICGDVNTAHQSIDLARPRENQNNTGFLPMEREWIDRLLAAGFTDTFRMFNSEGNNYSWWDMKTKARERNVGWRIDYFFAAEKMRKHVAEAFILPEIMGSDHCPVGITLKY